MINYIRKKLIKIRYELQWIPYYSQQFLIKKFYNCKITDDISEDNPKIGDVVIVYRGLFDKELAVFKEYKIEHRMSENDFRYYLEFIDGLRLNANGRILYKATGRKVDPCECCYNKQFNLS